MLMLRIHSLRGSILKRKPPIGTSFRPSDQRVGLRSDLVLRRLIRVEGIHLGCRNTQIGRHGQHYTQPVYNARIARRVSRWTTDEHKPPKSNKTFDEGPVLFALYLLWNEWSEREWGGANWTWVERTGAGVERTGAGRPNPTTQTNPTGPCPDLVEPARTNPPGTNPPGTNPTRRTRPTRHLLPTRRFLNPTNPTLLVLPLETYKVPYFTFKGVTVFY